MPCRNPACERPPLTPLKTESHLARPSGGADWPLFKTILSRIQIRPRKLRGIDPRLFPTARSRQSLVGRSDGFYAVRASPFLQTLSLRSPVVTPAVLPRDRRPSFLPAMISHPRPSWRRAFALAALIAASAAVAFAQAPKGPPQGAPPGIDPPEPFIPTGMFALPDLWVFLATSIAMFWWASKHKGIKHAA